MQPSSMLGAGAVQGVSGVTACLSSPQAAGLADHMHSQQHHFASQFDQASQPHNQAMDEFLEQMFSMPTWSDVAGGKVPWEYNNNVTTNTNNINNNNNNNNIQTQKLFTISLMPPGIGNQGLSSQENDDHGADSNLQYSYDESLLAFRLRQLSSNNTGMNSTPNQASSQGGITETTSPGRSMVLQLGTGNASASQLLASIGNSVMTRSPSSGGSSGSEGGMLPLPLSLGQGKPCDTTPSEAHLMGERSREVDVEASFKSANPARDSSPGGMFTTFGGSPVGPTRSVRQSAPQFHPQSGQVQLQGYGGMPQPQHQQQHQHQAVPVPGAVAAPARPRVRARRGQATDPHSIAERLRRERIAERMKALQELVPNSNKTDKASMLDEIIDYVKFLQLQVKVLSMSRLGGAGAVAPLVADIPSEGGNTAQATSLGRSNGSQSSSQDGLALTERQVAKLMEEDMGSAMQYLQGKGLCLMPISLATAISSSSASRSQSAPLQGLLASNASDRQILETTNSSLTTSSPEAEKASKAGNGTRIKESREANCVTKSNGLGSNHSKNSIKGEDEPQRMTGQ